MATRLQSFMSEKTAEYVLGPDLVRQLGHPSLTIFTFLSTREGNVRHDGWESVEADVISAFARRPKIAWKTHPEVQVMKINPVLADYSQASAGEGIPVLAGMPMISRLHEMNQDAQCSWIDLRPIGYLDEPLLLRFNTGDGPKGVLPCKAMTTEEIRSTMEGNWRPLEQIFQSLRSLRPILHLTRFGGYKPFHIVRTRSPIKRSDDPSAQFE